MVWRGEFEILIFSFIYFFTATNNRFPTRQGASRRGFAKQQRSDTAAGGRHSKRSFSSIFLEENSLAGGSFWSKYKEHGGGGGSRGEQPPAAHGGRVSGPDAQAHAPHLLPWIRTKHGRKSPVLLMTHS